MDCGWMERLWQWRLPTARAVGSAGQEARPIGEKKYVPQEVLIVCARFIHDSTSSVGHIKKNVGHNTNRRTADSMCSKPLGGRQKAFLLSTLFHLFKVF